MQRLLGAGLILAMGACATSAASNPGESEASAPVRIQGDTVVLPPGAPQIAALTTEAVQPAATDRAAALTGRLVWNENVTVRVFTPFAGRVMDVLADLGQSVARGDILARIAAPEFGQAQADARRAATDLDLAERTLSRVQDLFAHGVVARKDLEAAQADAGRARAETERTEARLTLYGGDSATVDQVFLLRAPLAGVVVERNITPGQEVRPDQMLANAPQLFAPLFVVTDPSRLWVLLDVPERDVGSLSLGQPLLLRTQSGRDRTFRGTVDWIASAVDSSTRTVKVRGRVERQGGGLKSEMLVAVEPRGTQADLAVPGTAILEEGDRQIVLVEVAPGHYVRRPVTTGAEYDGLMPVLSGLRTGDRVVIHGGLLLERLLQDGPAS